VSFLTALAKAACGETTNSEQRQLMNEDETNARKIRVGISTCLLGKNVCFDGGHKKDQYLSGDDVQAHQRAPLSHKDAIADQPKA
jgi:hypothetical protein